MSDNSTSKASSSNVPSVSFISSNFDNLELARAKAAESIVNVNQYFLEIKGEIKVYTDKTSLLGDNSENDNAEFEEDVNGNIEEGYLKSEDVLAMSMDIEEIRSEESDSRNNFTILPRSWTLKAQYTLPNIHQIIDTRASDKYTAGMIALKSAQWTEAIAHFTRCIHLKPNESSYYANRAEVFIQLADFQSAILNYKRACILDLGNHDFFNRLAFLYVFQSQVLFDQGQYPSALEAIGRAIEMTPTNKAFHIRAIGCLAALNRHSECLALVNKQLENDTSNADFYVLRAKLHSNFRNFSLCYFDLADALKIDPDHLEAQRVLRTMTEQAESLKNYAVERGLNNRLQEAISKLSLAIDLNPVVGDFHVKRGAFYRRLKDFTAAIDDFIMAMDKVDHDEQHESYIMAQRQLVMTFNDFAVACFNKSCYEDSLTLLNRAIQSEKNEPTFYMNRGDCFFKLEQWDFAIADYRQAASMAQVFLNPSLCRVALVHFSRGQAWFNGAKYADAERCFTDAIDSNPFAATFWTVRARTRYLIDDFKGSRKDLTCAILLAGLDKSLDSLFTRLFPGKSCATLLASKFTVHTKRELDRLLAGHAISERHQDVDNGATETTTVREQQTVNVSVCRSEEQMMFECVQHSRVLRDEIKRFSDDRSLIKKSLVHVENYPDVDPMTEDRSNVSGIVGRSDGSVYLLDNEGLLLRRSKPRGWRKFKNGITS